MAYHILGDATEGPGSERPYEECEGQKEPVRGAVIKTAPEPGRPAPLRRPKDDAECGVVKRRSV